MTRINLLPWRDERRKERRQDFGVTLAAAAILGVGIWAGGHQYYTALISHQQFRNQILQDEIRRLDRQIVQIRELENTKANLIARMNVIQQLQFGRPQVVHLFHQIAETVPDGVHLSGVKQAGGNLTITGEAVSNARVSNYMESLDRSDWLKQPRLDVIQVREAAGRRVSAYTLRVQQTTPTAKAQEGAAR